MNARNQLHGKTLNDISMDNLPKRDHKHNEIIGRLVQGNAANILTQRQQNNLFHLSTLHTHESILLLFRNGSSTLDRRIRWIWIDSDGGDREYTATLNNLIQPNRTIWQPTYPSNPWKILDAATNNVLAIYIPESNYPLHEIVIHHDSTVTVHAGNGASIL